ncbi:hypothetical protein A2304_01595 [Candidatus Uhrbacteria bacterium RIFOXYB2_FULL_57_15]|uniref:Uncharacterized protein n=1 Tax=Candidatus Uhrbacteria bacterium RIFOXYB2_FULL_57_15 TaxID=1802422 RepID=A0A1F7W6E3_9BACT|nr:MAG: hypothetical protein A2304_01595 [Candidatus Uhrbacteria bacterium RIFOXYB2_FULL_57_15]
MGKRAITVAVAAATILWSVGISSFVAPLTARAASSGDLIKGTTLSTVYYYGSDGSRYAFPNEKTYFSWYSDFSDVETISDSALAAISLAGNVVYRPGTRWVKIQSDPKTYVVTPEGQIRWVESEDVATDLAGSDWNTMIDDVPDTFFVDYTVGTSLTDAGDAYNGALVDMDGTTYLVWDGEMREVSSAGFSANRFQTRNVLDGAGMDLSGLDAGSSITSSVSALVDTAQLGGVEVTGGLSISLASDTPASSTIPAGASSVAFAKLKLMASSGSADVSQMVFRLGGIGGVDNIDSAYLYEGSVRLTDGRSVNSSTRNTTFSGLDISLASGETSYVTVKADISSTPTGGDTANFSLVEADSVTSSATVSGSFPISGNTMTFSETAAGTVTIDKSGSIADPTIGEEEAEIAEFTITASGEDAWLEMITVNVDSAADHSDYMLLNGGDVISTGVQVNDLVTFELTDTLFIEEGNDERFNVTATIGGEANDNIKVAIEEKTDVVAVGGDYGFNLSVDIDDVTSASSAYDETGSTCASSADDCSFSTIQGGELTFAFNGPSASDIQIDGKDQVMMEFTLTSANWTEIQEMAVIFADSGEDDDDDDDTGLKQTDEDTNLSDLAIRKSTGSIWMGPEELSGGDSASDATQTITFTDDQILQAGESLDLMITVDVDSGATADQIYTAAIDMSAVVAEDANGDDLATTDIVPSSDITGKNMTLVDSSLTYSASTPPSDGTYVKGSTGVSVAGFNFDAGDAADVTLTDLTVNVTGDSDATYGAENDIDVGDHVSSCSLYDSQSGSLVDGPESPSDNSATADLEFQSFDWTVAAGETGKLLVKCNFSNTALDTTDAASDTYAFSIADDTDITAEDADGDDVDATLNGTDGSADNVDGSVTTITIAAEGSLTATVDGSTASSTIILGASTGISVSKFKFAATDEPYVVTKFVLANCVTSAVDANGTCGDAGDETDGTDGIAAAVKISYTNSAGATETKTGYLSGGAVTFSNLDLYVATTTTSTVTVSVDTASVSSTGAASGAQIQLNLDAETSGASEFEAVGQSSGETYTEADIDTYVLANDMVIRKTKPTISLASGSPSGAGIAGNSEVFRFNVAADSRGYVTLDKVSFQVSTSDADNDFNLCDDAAGDTNLEDATKWELYDLDDSSTKLDDAGDWTFLDSGVSDASEDCDAGAVLAWAVLDFTGSATTGSEEIGAGETKTYVLKVDTTGASASDDDSIRIDIPDEATVDASDAFTGSDADEMSIQWDDDAEGTNADGTYIKNLAVTGGSIQY